MPEWIEKGQQRYEVFKSEKIKRQIIDFVLKQDAPFMSETLWLASMK